MNRPHTASDYMSSRLIIVKPDMNIHAAMKVLLKNRISGAPVVDDSGVLVGILSKRDCLKIAFSATYHKEWGGSVAEYMSREVETVDAGTDIVEVAERFLKGPYRRFPVLAQGRLVGQISRHDVLRALDELW